jgi:cytochrome P450/NADPH-cytochrome P450 reductase
MSAVKEVPIPGPRGVPILGNIYDIEPEVPANSFELLAENYGMLDQPTTTKGID